MHCPRLLVLTGLPALDGRGLSIERGPGDRKRMETASEHLGSPPEQPTAQSHFSEVTQLVGDSEESKTSNAHLEYLAPSGEGSLRPPNSKTQKQNPRALRGCGLCEWWSSLSPCPATRVPRSPAFSAGAPQADRGDLQGAQALVLSSCPRINAKWLCSWGQGPCPVSVPCPSPFCVL